jgi:hypothetical protein
LRAPVADSPAAATRRSYVCNRTADGDSDWSVARIEEAAQAAYNGIEFGLNTPPSTDCKRFLHQWVCWQVRPGGFGARQRRFGLAQRARFRG